MAGSEREETLITDVRRRRFLTGGLVGGGAALLGAFGRALAGAQAAMPHSEQVPPDSMDHTRHAGVHGGMTTVGRVDDARNGFDPHAMLTDWDTGEVSRAPDGRTLRTWDIVAVDREIEIAPGVFFPAWTYNGRVPGPTLRATEGDRLRVNFHNAGSHPHTIHFHGIHPASMDGVPGIGAGIIEPGEGTVYEFDALPFGCHLYHCHSVPLKRHIHKGLYGAFIVDPDPDRHPQQRAAARSRLLGTPENAQWQEMVMVMNGFDTNFDDENEVYAANTVAHAYMHRPIEVQRDRPIRVYLVNITEFDPVNSFHLHANFFDYYDHGTTLEPTLRTVDTVMQCQAQRGILEFTFEGFEPGRYMFHAHQSEFAELGWMAVYEVVA